MKRATTERNREKPIRTPSCGAARDQFGLCSIMLGPESLVFHWNSRERSLATPLSSHFRIDIQKPRGGFNGDSTIGLTRGFTDKMKGLERAQSSLQPFTLTVKPGQRPLHFLASNRFRVDSHTWKSCGPVRFDLVAAAKGKCGSDCWKSMYGTCRSSMTQILSGDEDFGPGG